MSRPPIRSVDYQVGYWAGYHARQRTANGHHLRVDWRCANCDVRGVTLRHSRDTDVKFQWRLKQSHYARSRRCSTMRLLRLTKREARREPIQSRE